MKPTLRLMRVRSAGIVLIFVAGVLAVLAAMGTAFFALTQSGTASAVRYSDMVRAEFLARAGMQEAVARLRSMAYLKTEDPSDPWYNTDWVKGGKKRISLAYGTGTDTDGDGIADNETGKAYRQYSRALGSSVGDDSDRYTLEIDDAASKINVNACDNLAVVLNNLCWLIGPPLMPADQNMLQPRRWGPAAAGEGGPASYGTNADDTATSYDLYFTLDTDGRPVQKADGTAVYGDGYAIAGYRGRNGTFQNLESVKLALTWVERNGNAIADDPLEVMEVETKFAALRPYITTDSWVDTNTVCVGKFEWVWPNKYDGSQDPGTFTVKPLVATIGNPNQDPEEITCQVLIDRDKSWVADDPVGDPLNQRGSLRGSWVSIVNGHGAGQLRRIATNGTDWIAVRYDYADMSKDERMVVVPGPISSYMIMARDTDAYLHGGVNRVNTRYLPPNVLPSQAESPKYRVQPFRWHFSGARWNYGQSTPVPDTSGGSKGHWVTAEDYANPTNVHLLTKNARCFIDTQMDPDTYDSTAGAPNWSPNFYWERHAMYGVGWHNVACDLGNTGAQSLGDGRTGTDVKYDWANPVGTNATWQLKCFGLNNLNYNNDAAIYRYVPEDGTYAVIDELKISNRDRIMHVGGIEPANADWTSDRISNEQTLSRYYLPSDPVDRTQCPTFTSQTLLQSLRGFDQTSSSETVTVARLTWNVFTPRFMHEYKQPGTFDRTEYFYRNWVALAAPASGLAHKAVSAHAYADLAGPKANPAAAATMVAFKGPFDFVKYNDDTNATACSVKRPHRSQYPGGQAHASKGVEVELLDDTTPLAAKQQDSAGVFQDAVSDAGTGSTKSILTNPDVSNQFGEAAAPTRVRTDRLRYRVRFRYPVDPLVDPTGGATVNPTNHYLLDTPVFDDISVTYFTKLRIIYWHEVTE